MHLAYNSIKGAPKPLKVFYNQTDCRTYLEELCKVFALCPKYCHLQETNSSCSHHILNSCEGICASTEVVTDYNAKVEVAISSIKASQSEVHIIKEKGRTIKENAVVLIDSGVYKGYGFIDDQLEVSSIADIEAFIIPQKNTVETDRILNSYLLKKSSAIEKLTVFSV